MGSPLDDVLDATRARIGPEADAWARRVPALLRELAARWELTLGDPLGGGPAFTLAATRGADAEPVVLKVAFPDAWFDESTRALGEVDGDGMVLLLDHQEEGAQLLERAVPGSSLVGLDESEADGIAAGVLERIWRPSPGGFVTVADEAARWADSMPDRLAAHRTPIERPLADLAVETIRELVGAPTESLLLHGDLHHGTVLSASREPWLAISPKPLVGERAFDVAALLRGRRRELLRDPDPHARLQARFDRLSARFECDRRRLREWAFATLVDGALWDAEAGVRGRGDDQARMARLVRSLEV